MNDRIIVGRGEVEEKIVAQTDQNLTRTWVQTQDKRNDKPSH